MQISSLVFRSLAAVISVLCILVFDQIHAQYPFDFGKTDSIYYFSRHDIDSLNIYHIYEVEPLNEQGSMGQDINIFDCDYADDDGIIRERWLTYSSTSNDYDLQLLIDSAWFVNGGFWYLENDELSSVGLEGYGSLCESDVITKQGFKEYHTYCKGEDSIGIRKVFYHENGLVNYMVCCDKEYMGDDESLDENPNSFLDTTWNVYDEDWRIVSFVESKDTVTALRVLEDSRKHDFSENYSLFVNQEPFEDFIDQNIGFRPKTILFEIYRNAVFVFRYNPEHKRYWRGRTESAE